GIPPSPCDRIHGCGCDPPRERLDRRRRHPAPARPRRSRGRGRLMDAVNHKPARARSRANQRLRTRKDLLRAAARLLAAGRTPTLEEVAAEALVSRATAYRYFPGIEALLLEAALDVAI